MIAPTVRNLASFRLTSRSTRETKKRTKKPNSHRLCLPRFEGNQSVQLAPPRNPGQFRDPYHRLTLDLLNLADFQGSAFPRDRARRFSGNLRCDFQSELRSPTSATGSREQSEFVAVLRTECAQDLVHPHFITITTL